MRPCTNSYLLICRTEDPRPCRKTHCCSHLACIVPLRSLIPHKSCPSSKKRSSRCSRRSRRRSRSRRGFRRTCRPRSRKPVPMLCRSPLLACSPRRRWRDSRVDPFPRRCRSDRSPKCMCQAHSHSRSMMRPGLCRSCHRSRHRRLSTCCSGSKADRLLRRPRRRLSGIPSPRRPPRRRLRNFRSRSRLRLRRYCLSLGDSTAGRRFRSGTSTFQQRRLRRWSRSWLRLRSDWCQYRSSHRLRRCSLANSRAGLDCHSLNKHRHCKSRRRYRKIHPGRKNRLRSSSCESPARVSRVTHRRRSKQGGPRAAP